MVRKAAVTVLLGVIAVYWYTFMGVLYVLTIPFRLFSEV